jgi:hypothetical protein
LQYAKALANRDEERLEALVVERSLREQRADGGEAQRIPAQTETRSTALERSQPPHTPF